MRAILISLTGKRDYLRVPYPPRPVWKIPVPETASCGLYAGSRSPQPTAPVVKVRKFGLVTTYKSLMSGDFVAIYKEEART